MQWKAHSGQKARMRNLRQACRPILESKDSEDQKQVARVREAVKHEPLPEFGLLHLIHSSLEASDQTGEKWSTCMKYMMDKFDDIADDRAVSAPIPLNEELHA